MKKTKIDWADSTWNPVTGCKHGCEYCYAERIAARFSGHSITHSIYKARLDANRNPHIYEFDTPAKRIDKDGKLVSAPYPFWFTPTLHRYKMDEPKRWTKPRTIFVCSMADLFGRWVPDDWIEEVFKACEDAPQHTYLFLTKNPGRYVELANAGKLPTKANFWYGSSTPTKEAEFFYHGELNTFVSIEPILEPFTDLLDDGIDAVRRVGWVIVGAETGNRAGKVIPEKSWIMELKNAADECGVPIFMKESLREIMGSDFKQETPWEVFL